MHIIQTKHLSKTYTSGKKNGYQVEVLRDIEVGIQSGEYIGVMGKSGSGKTTLLNIIGSLDVPTEGDIYYNGDNYNKMNFSQIEEFRRNKIGYIFQDFRLVDNLKLKENIVLPMIFEGEDYTACDRRVNKLAETFQITGLLDKHPYEISGGEKQRAAICRALVNNPDLILADEPTGNLDSQAAEVLINEIGRINKEFHKTVVIVTHDPYVASHCSRILFLKDGEVLNTMEKPSSREEFYNQILDRMNTL